MVWYYVVVDKENEKKIIKAKALALRDELTLTVGTEELTRAVGPGPGVKLKKLKPGRRLLCQLVAIKALAEADLFDEFLKEIGF